MFVKEINVLPYYEQSTLLSQDTCNLLHVMSQNCNTCDLTGKLNLCVAGGTEEKKKTQICQTISMTCTSPLSSLESSLIQVTWAFWIYKDGCFYTENFSPKPVRAEHPQTSSQIQQQL